MGALGSLLVYASRALSQSVSDSTVQQGAVVALRQVSDDLVQTTIYSLYSVGDPANHLTAANGLNVTFMSPNGVSSQPNSKVFSYAAANRPNFRTWVAYSVDSDRKLVRYDKDATAPLDIPSPPLSALNSPTLLSDFTSMPANGWSRRTVVKGIVTQAPSGSPVTDGFSIGPALTPGGRAANLVLKVQDFFGSDRFQQLNLSTQVYLRNTAEP